MESLLGFGFYLREFVIALTVVVFVHEYGHYWVARRNGVRVDAFSIGFGPELFGWNDKHGTRWKFCWIPLGGYVKMHGDADAASSTVDQKAALDPDSFPAKRVGQRAAIVAAGPAANFIFSILVLSLLFVFYGRAYTPAVVGTVMEDRPAAAAGILEGDRILSIDGEEVETFQDLTQIIYHQPDVPLQFVISRGDERVEMTITPALDEIEDVFGNLQRVGLIGIGPATSEYVKVGPTEAVVAALDETQRIVVGTLTAIGEIIIGARGADALGGPLRIGQMAGDVAEHGIVSRIQFFAVLSISLGLINLFPIPVLDGGHLVFYSIEAARGRPLTERAQEIAFRIGLAVVMSLMLFVTWNDLVQLEVIQRITGIFS